MSIGALTKSGELKPLIARFVTTTVKQEAKNFEWVKKREPKIEVTILYPVLRPIRLGLLLGDEKGKT